MVADCNNASMPYDNLFEHRICCTPTEYCRDGVDNTGDGLADCQSPDCYGFASRCDPDGVPGNNQSTADCVEGFDYDAEGDLVAVYSDHCLNDVGEPYYCSYEDDDSSNEPGICCVSGERAYQDLDTGAWYCDEPTQCGISTKENDDFECDFDFNLNRNGWISSLFSGNEDNWCHSALPQLTMRFGASSYRSQVCCPVMHSGTFGYYVIDENVKIYGYKE